MVFVRCSLYNLVWKSSLILHKIDNTKIEMHPKCTQTFTENPKWVQKITSFDQKSQILPTPRGHILFCETNTHELNINKFFSVVCYEYNMTKWLTRNIMHLTVTNKAIHLYRYWHSFHAVLEHSMGVTIQIEPQPFDLGWPDCYYCYYYFDRYAFHPQNFSLPQRYGGEPWSRSGHRTFTYYSNTYPLMCHLLSFQTFTGAELGK